MGKGRGEGNASFLFKGRGSPNEAELIFVDPSSNTVVNVLTDMYRNRLDEEITRLLKKKETAKSIESGECEMAKDTDWRGNFITKTIDGFKTTKFKAKAHFLVAK